MKNLRFAPLLLAACGTAPVDLTATAADLGGVQPALEAGAALAMQLDACADCGGDLEKLRAFLADRFSGCALVEPALQAQSGCAHLAGKQAVKMTLTSCDLSLDGRFDGTVFVAPAAGGKLDYEIQLDDSPVELAACGDVDGLDGVHAIRFDAVALGDRSIPVAVGWSGQAKVDDDELVRTGSFVAQFHGSDGLDHAAQVEVKSLRRTIGDDYPHEGSLLIEAGGSEVELRFLESSPADHDAEVSLPDGTKQTVSL